MRTELEAEFAVKLAEEKKKVEAAVRAEYASIPSPEYSVTKSWEREQVGEVSVSVCNSACENPRVVDSKL